MSRKSRTVATFAVTIQVPFGTNLSDVQLFIRRAISTCGFTESKNTTQYAIPEDSFTVALTKKVTTYGSN